MCACLCWLLDIFVHLVGWLVDFSLRQDLTMTEESQKLDILQSQPPQGGAYIPVPYTSFGILS